MANQVDSLNALLKGELSAVETYTMALDKAKTPEVIAVLNDSRSCHQARATKLAQLVTAEGGTPTKDAGAWGAFAKAVEAGSVVLGEGPALGSLQEGEDHGVEVYKSEMKHLEGSVLSTVESEFYAAQLRTQKAMEGLTVSHKK